MREAGRGVGRRWAQKSTTFPSGLPDLCVYRESGTENGTGDVSSDVCDEISPTRTWVVGDGLKAHHGKAAVRCSQ